MEDKALGLHLRWASSGTPNMFEQRKPECFVIMPFGKKTLADGSIGDFDAVYQNIIVPAVAAADLCPLRADEGGGSNLIHPEMFRKLRDTPVVLADLSTANPNVFYELGLRHVMSPQGTVLICRKGVPVPFDVALLRVIGYGFKGGRPSEKETVAAVADVTAALREAMDKVNSPVHTFLPLRVLRLPAEVGQRSAAARRLDTDPTVKYPRALAAAWRASGYQIGNLFKEHAGDPFGVRALGYFCLERPHEDPVMALRAAWELSRAEEYDLANALYSELKQAGLVVGKELLKMASTSYDARVDEQGIKIATAYVQEVLKNPITDGPTSDLRVPTREEIRALAQSRLGSLLHSRWELKKEAQSLEKAIQAYAAARKLMERARSNGNFPYPGMVAHTLLKLLVLHRITNRAAVNPDGIRDAVLAIMPADEDDQISISYLDWAKAIVLADMGKGYAVREKVGARLVLDANLTGVLGGIEIGRRQYGTLLRFLERYQESFLNPPIVEQIIEQISQHFSGGRSA